MPEPDDSKDAARCVVPATENLSFNLVPVTLSRPIEGYHKDWLVLPPSALNELLRLRSVRIAVLSMRERCRHEISSPTYMTTLSILKQQRSESFSLNSIANRMDYLSILLRLIEKPGKLLDYGCGFGTTLSLLNRIEAIETVGFETSAVRAEELKHWHSTILQVPESLRAHGPFTAIILDNVLEHVPEPKQTIDFLNSVCADNGILHVSVPDMNRRYIATQIAVHNDGKQLAMDINPWEHLNYFDLFQLDRLLAEHGFAPLKQAALPGEIRIGLRPSTKFNARVKNSLASLKRLGDYVWLGDALATPNMRFYRKCSGYGTGWLRRNPGRNSNKQRG